MEDSKYPKLFIFKLTKEQSDKLDDLSITSHEHKAVIVRAALELFFHSPKEIQRAAKLASLIREEE